MRLLEQKLRQLLEGSAHSPPAQVAEQVGRTLRDWKGDDNHQDDITLLIVEAWSQP